MIERYVVLLYFCSAQCVDSKSLAQLGVYVARGSEPRSFVNIAPAQRSMDMDVKFFVTPFVCDYSSSKAFIDCF